MNLLHSINSKNYKPISFRERYFYDYYDIINSFLKTKLDQEDINRLLKPMLIGAGEISWYGNYSGDFKRLTEWDEKIITNVRTEFEQFIVKIQQLATTLKNKRDIENTEWGNLISDLFQHEHIILINNNQGEWGILWGWDFMTNDENRLPILEPSRKEPEPEEIDEQKEDDKPDDDSGGDDSGRDKAGGDVSGGDVSGGDEDGGDEDGGVEDDPESEKTVIYSERMGCLGRIKHFLRWVSYRFWALFWFFIYTLLIIWLCRYCDRPNCDAYCEKLKKTKEELKRLEERVRERCDTTYVKPI